MNKITNFSKKLKVVVDYIDKPARVVFVGYYVEAFKQQSKWVLKAKKDKNIKAVYYESEEE